jgi:hypothetical protein
MPDLVRQQGGEGKRNVLLFFFQDVKFMRY